METLVIKGAGLTIEDVVNVGRHGQKVELHPDAVKRINACREMLERKIVAGEIMYGVNTGIGEFSEVVLNDDQVKDFQKYLIYNHAAGIGDPAPIEYVRGAMLGRINVHAHGNSGSRLDTNFSRFIKQRRYSFCLSKRFGWSKWRLSPNVSNSSSYDGRGQSILQRRINGFKNCYGKSRNSSSWLKSSRWFSNHKRLEFFDCNECNFFGGRK